MSGTYSNSRALACDRQKPCWRCYAAAALVVVLVMGMVGCARGRRCAELSSGDVVPIGGVRAVVPEEAWGLLYTRTAGGHGADSAGRDDVLDSGELRRLEIFGPGPTIVVSEYDSSVDLEEPMVMVYGREEILDAESIAGSVPAKLGTPRVWAYPGQGGLHRTIYMLFRNETRQLMVTVAYVDPGGTLEDAAEALSRVFEQ
ncbi:MAG: hypothetical protein H5T75_08875 [Coriobacteriia bacterium]|nr:hypothetical protein [Coriobacteriia bacterium]